MSKFHFDENAVTNVHTELKEALVRMVAYSARFTEASNMLYDYMDFGIFRAIELSKQEQKELKLCIEKIESGVNTLNLINEKVIAFSDSAEKIIKTNVKKYIDDNTYPNGTYINPFYKYTAGDITEKYFSKDNLGFILSQIKDGFWDKIFNDGYEKAIVYDTLRSVIDNLNENNNIPNYIGNIIDKYKYNELSSAANIIKELSGYEGFKNLMSYVGEAKFDLDIIKLLASDYSVNLEYLNSVESVLKETGMDNDVLNDVMNSLRYDYEHKYIDAIKKTLKNVSITAFETGLSTLEPGKAVLDIKKFSAEAGGGKANDSKKNFLAITTYSNNLSNALEKLGDKIASGNYTQQDLTDFENLFNITKNLKIKQYSSALNFVNSDDANYCNEAIAYYQNLSI